MWDDLISIFKTLPVIGKVLILLFATFIGYVIIKPYIEDFFDLLKNVYTHIKEKILGFKTKVISTNDNGNKIFYNKLKLEIEEIKLNASKLNFGNKNKNKIFKTIIYTYIDSLEMAVEKLLDPEINDRNNNDFIDMVSKLKIDYETCIDRRLKKNLGSDVYNIVMTDPVKGFYSWTKIMEDSTSIIIDEFCRDDFIKNNYTRLYFILKSLTTSVYIIIQGVEKRFYDFNGDLTEVIKHRKNNNLSNFLFY